MAIITPEIHEKLIELWKENIRVDEMAKLLKISESTIYRHLKANPSDFPKRTLDRKISGAAHIITPEIHEKIIMYLHDNMTIADIARKVYVSPSAIFSHINANPCEFEHLKKEKIVITPEIHNYLVALWESNVRVEDMAEELKIPDMTIWRHIETHRNDFKKRSLPRRTSVITPQIHEKLVSYWETGMNIKNMAIILKVSESSIYRYVNANPIVFPKRKKE